MLRLFPVSVVILGLILLRLCYVHGVFVGAQTVGDGRAAGPVNFTPGSSTDLEDVTPDRKKWIDNMAREALTAPTPEARSAAALATADQSTSKIAQMLRSVNAAEEVVMENLSQADTTGFKATRCTPRGERVRYSIDLTQGSLKSTNGQLDVAIRGNGVFAVSNPGSLGNEVEYTRCGYFFVNNKNELVAGIGDGYRMIPAIKIPSGVTDITIGQDGTIQVLLPGTGTKQTVGRLALTWFVNPSGLSRQPDGLLMATSESGPAINGLPGENGMGLVQQGFLECSNVDLPTEQMRLKFLHNWRAALDEALVGNGRRGVASTN
ncbi:MAG TPA: flagellar basal body rod C-terminal domain-containing protein [Tepidisphaeraceae bacterium]